MPIDFTYVVKCPVLFNKTEAELLSLSSGGKWRARAYAFAFSSQLVGTIYSDTCIPAAAAARVRKNILPPF